VPMEEIKARIEQTTIDLGMDIESVTGKFRAAHDNITVAQMWDLPVETVYSFARQLVAYAAQQSTTTQGESK
jgi:hypothetical protein